MDQPNPAAEKLIIKKDFFIKSRKEDIRNYYEFSPKVPRDSLRSLAEEPTGWSTRPRLKEPPHTYRVVKLIAKKMVKNPESLEN